MIRISERQERRTTTSNWTIALLESMLTESVQNGYSPVCPKDPTGKWILSLGSVSISGLVKNSVKPAPLNNPKVKNFILRSGDFLVSRSNTRDLVGLSVLFRGEIENCSYPDLLMKFRVDNRKVIDEYIEQYLRSEKALAYLQKNASGTSGSMVKINKKILEKLPVPIPPLPEQQKIAQILSTWDRAIDTLEALIAAKQKRKTGLMQQLLTGKRRLPGFSGAWKEMGLRDLARESKTRNPNKLGKESVRAVNKTLGMIPMKDRTISNDLDRYKTVEKNWFAYNPMRINIGSICIWDKKDPVLVSPDYVVFFCRPNILVPHFLHYVRMTHRWDQYVQFSGNGSVRVRIYFNDLGNFRFQVPPYEEQQKIAAVLSVADREIDTHQRQLDALKTQKKGLMQQLLTGKKRVVLDEADLPTAVEG